MPDPQQPLFPQPIPIIGCTGEYASGKTIFGVTIAPRETLVYDVEKSCETYQSLGFTRIDVPVELQKRYPHGYKPLQTYEWWRDHMRSLPPRKHRVAMLDPASDIESGLVEWVRGNPGYFGHTAAQHTKMEGLMWGDVKELWKTLLADLASRVEVFVFTVHMGDVWKGGKPVEGKRKPKGKSTLMELASLYLQMERRADLKGNVPAKPAAIVLKSRLMHTRVDGDGEIAIVPALPPRLPIATPSAIRQYLLHPPDYSHLRPEELAPEPVTTEDDRALVRLATVEAERDAEQLRLERLQRQQEAEERARTRKQTSEKATSSPTKAVPSENGSGPAPSSATAAATANGQATEKASSTQRASFSAHAITEEQLQSLAELRDAWFKGPLAQVSDEERKEAWRKVLAKRKVNTARALTRDQADELISRLKTQIDIRNMEQGLYRPENAEVANSEAVKGEAAEAAASGG